MRAVALPQTESPQWAAIVDLPFTNAIEARLRDETGIRLGDVSALAYSDSRVADAARTPLEARVAGQRPHDGRVRRGWVAFLDVRHWQTGATNQATVAIRLNIREIYDRIIALSSSREIFRLLLLVLAFIGVLFLIIQFVALVIGIVLARQITGAVHDLFTGTEHLRNRNFTAPDSGARARSARRARRVVQRDDRRSHQAPEGERREGADGAGDARGARDPAEAAAVGPAAGAGARHHGVLRTGARGRGGLLRLPARSPTPSSAC